MAAMAAASHRPGFELPLLLVGAFRSVIDELHRDLAAAGHPDVRPVHGFALQAVGPEGATTSELGRRLGVSKQAAAKTAAGLAALGYLVDEPDPSDGRARILRRTARGDDCLRASVVAFEAIRRRWVAALGADRVAALEDDLEAMAGPAGAGLGDLPGWLR